MPEIVKIRLVTSLKAALLTTALLQPCALLADSNTPGKVIAGWVENITLMEAGGVVQKAKLDTGAKSSSIDARNINISKSGGRHWVEFDLVVRDGDSIKLKPMRLPRERRVRIKEHDGDHDSRPVIAMNICFDGRPQTVQFTLADRREFIYPVLLGRRFLAGTAVIDPEQTFNLQARCNK